MKHYQELHREEWKGKIKKWSRSGKSGVKWCREYQISYSTFTYWKKRITQAKANPPSKKSTFIELSDHSPRNIGIEIHCQKLSLKLHKDFDLPSLYKIIKLLQGI